MDSLARSGDESTVVYVLLGIGVVGLLVLLGIPMLIALFTINLRARSLDAIFTPSK